jgi:hypothetical protein
VSDQLTLDLDAGKPNPNGHLFNDDGTPKRLLWCSDTARKGGPCPYIGAKAKFMPGGVCCKTLAARA